MAVFRVIAVVAVILARIWARPDTGKVVNRPRQPAFGDREIFKYAEVIVTVTLRQAVTLP